TASMRSAVGSNYIRCAIEGESGVVARAQPSTRNYALNRAAFKLGTIPDLPTDTAVGALLIASKTNGYLKQHGEIATRKVIMSGLRNGQANLRQPVLQERKDPRATPIAELEATRYPIRTSPDAQGKPHFHLWGAGGPPIRSDQKRRHVY